jgi:hypothetical protein
VYLRAEVGRGKKEHRRNEVVQRVGTRQDAERKKKESKKKKKRQDY